MGEGTAGSLRDLNRLRVVDELRLNGTLSRSDIARRTGLSRSTVSLLVNDLVERGYVVERSEPERATQGRPPVLLSLDGSAGAAVGVDFDHIGVRVGVSDLSRTVLAEVHRAVDVDHDAENALDLATELIAQVLEEAGVSRSRVLGVGVALSGPVDQNRGGLHPSSVLPAWETLDAYREFEQRLGLPVHIDNDANLGALAEVTLGAGRNARHAAYVQMSSGIGAGLIVDGRPYRGFAGTAGEIGHIVVDSSGEICRCGNRGCLETLASGPALTRSLARSHGEDLTVEKMIRLAREGDIGCRRAIADAGRHVGSVVASICNLFNPEMVVVGGDLGSAGELLIAPLRESLERSAPPFATRGVDVVAGKLGERANLLGALALATAQSEHAVAARIAAREVGA